MGNEVSRNERRWRKQNKIVVIGPEESGRSGVVLRMKQGEVYNMERYTDGVTEEINFGGIIAAYMDFGATRDSLRPFFTIYYPGALGIVFVIDSADKEKLDEALDMLVTHVLLNDATQNKIIMILANKQDLPEAMEPRDIEEALQEKFKFSPASKHTVFVLPCSVKANQGLTEAFEFFLKMVQIKKLGQAPAGLIPYSDTIFAHATLQEKEVKKPQMLKIKEGVKQSFISINSFFCRQR